MSVEDIRAEWASQAGPYPSLSITRVQVARLLEEYDTLKADKNELAVLLAIARMALAHYGQHQSGCAAGFAPSCTCGLDAVEGADLSPFVDYMRLCRTFFEEYADGISTDKFETLMDEVCAARAAVQR